MKTLPCVGFELNYSPFERDCVENLLQLLGSKHTTVAFDVHEEVEPNQQLVVLFSNQHKPTEKLYGKIIECRQINDDTYRVRVNLCKADASEDMLEHISLPVIKGISTPTEISLTCPACASNTSFNLIANQNGAWDKGIMPLYNCESCGTTRAMIGLLEYNCKQAKND